MLKKLLKHDFKSLFKYWWIAAIVSLCLGVLAGFCLPIMISEKEIPVILRVSTFLGFFVSVIGIVVFSLFSTIMIFARFYKNLFTDEGYLTFTLPVKRASILNSKLLSAVCLLFATYFVSIFSIIIALVICFAKDVFTAEFVQKVFDGLGAMIDGLGGYFFVYIFEGIAILAAITTFTTLFMFVCITLASVISKKARVILAVGIYYFANAALTSVAQILMLFSIPSVVEKLSALPANNQMLAVSGVLLCITLFISVLCGVLYMIEYYMLERKLNLL